MFCKKILFIVILFSLILSGCVDKQTTEKLPRSIPEAEGVSSGNILRFIDAAENSKNELHSFMFLRHGKVIAEGWWYPYRDDLKHTLYSTSKSFTSTAVGFAVTENLLGVEDKVISFFPEDMPDTISPYLSGLTVKNLLTMSVGQDPDPTHLVVSRDSNWIKGFFSIPIVDEPGTKFLYNSLATYMLSAIVQEVTGEKVIDYLTPRLFEPLGIQNIDWEVDPGGINTGGWGLRVKTEDMAKFGQLYLQEGKWNDIQILPEEWVEEATTIKIEQAPDLPQAVKDSSDWLQGYCYQFWRCRHHAFRADGAYGQFIIVMPDQDAVVAITAETSDMQDELNLVWEHLLPAMHETELSANDSIIAALKEKLSSLALPLPEKSDNPSFVKSISGKTFILEPTESHNESMSFTFSDHVCHLTIQTDTAVYELTFGSGEWQTGETTRRGPYLLSTAKASLTGLSPFKVAGSYRWEDENTLKLLLRYIESPHTETMICHFDQNKISVDIQYSFIPRIFESAWKGELKE
jgi:CubicO group peptidase (beta-lactamase class C family)